MRPQPEGRGEQLDVPFQLALAALASMRPRPEGRGEPKPRPRWSVPAPASMRPRPEGRGERVLRLAHGRQARRFNAATTRRPWRTPRPSPSCWGLSWLQCGHDPKAVENEGVLLVPRDGAALQCGHDPKAVENRTGARTASGRRRTLQCGHDPKAVENSLSGRMMTRRLGASMRPRPEGRGEQGLVGVVLACQHRLQCGHDPKAVENRPALPRLRGRRGEGLQCGHDPKAVENFHRGPEVVHFPAASMRPRPEGRGERVVSTPRSIANVSLQCGHDPKAVENRRPGGVDHANKTSFNAATTRRPWRTGVARLQARGLVQLQCGHDPKAVENEGTSPYMQAAFGGLQCGHDPKAVENVYARGHTRGHTDASMRPRPEGRGERLDRAPADGGRRGFNAATTRRPWRTTLAGPPPSQPGALQCGHNPKAVENRALGVVEVAGARASMRPRPEGRGERRPATLMRRRGTMALQCGHDPKAVENQTLPVGNPVGLLGFNAATTRRPWRTALDRLRCGQT